MENLWCCKRGAAPWETFTKSERRKGGGAYAGKKQQLSAAYADTKRGGVKEREEREPSEKNKLLITRSLSSSLHVLFLLLLVSPTFFLFASAYEIKIMSSKWLSSEKKQINHIR